MCKYLKLVLERSTSDRQVPLWSLRPPSEENSWSTVVNRGDKKLSNGHGGACDAHAHAHACTVTRLMVLLSPSEWEERSRGRGRGRNVASASSVSPATAPGASGRVQKQHSWPPQATVEEQAGAKGVRCVCVIDQLLSGGFLLADEVSGSVSWNSVTLRMFN